MKKVMCILLCLMIMSVPAWGEIAIDGNVIRVAGPGTWGSGNARTVATMVKVATEAAPAWYAVRYGWSSIAIMAACVVGSYLFGKALDAAYNAWITPLLGANNYRINADGTIQKKTGTQVYQPAVEGMADSLESWLSANGYTPYIINWYPNLNAAVAMSGWWEQGHMVDVPWSGQQVAPMVGVGQIYRHDPHTTACTVGIGNERKYIIGAYPVAAGAVELVDLWEGKTVAQMQSDLAAAIADGTVTEAEKAAWEAIEKLIEAEKNGSAARSVLDAKDAAGKTLDERLKEETQKNLDGNATPSPDINPAIQSLTNAISALYTMISNGFTNIKSWLGVDDTVADQTNTGVDPAENDTVINTTQIDTDKEAAKLVTTGLLDNLFEATTGLSDRIEAKVQSMIGVGSSVCSLPFSVFGASQSLDFCSIDFATLRNCVLFVGTVAAALIIAL